MKKEGFRKFGHVLINQGDKLRPEQKIQLTKENKILYGLSEEYLATLKLPKSSNIKIYNIDKIKSGKKLFTIPEQLEHLSELRKTLMDRLNFVKLGGIMKNHENLKYEDFKAEKLKKENPVDE